MRYWPEGLIVVLLLALAAVGVLYEREHWYHHRHARPRKVAEVPGPPASGRAYQLEYAENGDLVFRPSAGNPVITFYDYYGDVRVARSEWLTPDHVRLTMQDGTVMDIRVGFTIDYGGAGPGSNR